MDKDQLAALDRAATQGVWATETEAGDEWWFGGSYGDGMETVVRVGDGIANIVAGGADNADLKLAANLVNLYRTGKLVLIDDGAVEALRASKQGWENVVEIGLLPPQHHDTARALTEQCRTALSALGVK